MPDRYYVFATLGTSPAVVTELLYHLTVCEGAEVVGLEIWTTGPADASAPSRTGKGDLDAFVLGGRWATFLDAVGPERAARLPSPMAPQVADSVGSAVTAGRRPYVVQVFEGEDGPLSDVRSPDDARHMDEALFRRVQALIRDLPTDVVLLGSLAGGRKTMSAGLQGAFSLLGRPTDRLVHVLLHPRIEAAGFPALSSYVAPTAEWATRTGVPEAEQVTLHDVHFPMLRTLLERATVPGYASLSHLIAEDYATFLGEMHRLARTPASTLRATLRRQERNAGWQYDVEAGGRTASVELSLVEGHVLAALISLREPSELETIYRWLVAHGREPHPDGEKEGSNAISQAVRRLRVALKALTPALAEFTVDSPVRGRFVVPAARDGRVELLQRDIQT